MRAPPTSHASPPSASRGRGVGASAPRHLLIPYKPTCRPAHTLQAGCPKAGRACASPPCPPPHLNIRYAQHWRHNVSLLLRHPALQILVAAPCKHLSAVRQGQAVPATKGHLEGGGGQVGGEGEGRVRRLRQRWERDRQEGSSITSHPSIHRHHLESNYLPNALPPHTHTHIHTRAPTCTNQTPPTQTHLHHPDPLLPYTHTHRYHPDSPSLPPPHTHLYRTAPPHPHTHTCTTLTPANALILIGFFSGPRWPWPRVPRAFQPQDQTYKQDED